ncbi:hypothetical protein CLOP_g22208 [Closterium sp. NIES-67]|nr:hypothetical protein CLOP_g22208 [Closterium sp. NIES-67]
MMRTGFDGQGGRQRVESGSTERANEWSTKECEEEEAKPMQLLRPSANHDRLEVVQSTLDVLERIHQPVAFVAVVGPYHGGKSFLLNVLLNSTRGFPVGTRPDPETLGLWIRIVPPHRLQTPGGAVVVLVDSEGLYGDGASRAYDAKLFAVATLLSSHLIYNTLRTLVGGGTGGPGKTGARFQPPELVALGGWGLAAGDAGEPWNLGGAGASGGQESTSQALEGAGKGMGPRTSSRSGGGVDEVDGAGGTADDDDSAAADGTAAASSHLPDPRLLLQTLTFPPLTWVVQGFDLDLEPDHSSSASPPTSSHSTSPRSTSSHSPSHSTSHSSPPSASPLLYLQRYLAAHARTGDQSLDTLFTQGIACLTVRTPTDINRLREEVGGAGLGAADVELMSALHPGYLADVAAVRERVVAGLEAKGTAPHKFTGAIVARLLPLLVHFVNSDFPLNAERHIQQVMLDLLLDGAFASAVHFFRLHADAALDRFTRATRAAAAAAPTAAGAGGSGGAAAARWAGDGRTVGREEAGGSEGSEGSEGRGDSGAAFGAGLAAGTAEGVGGRKAAGLASPSRASLLLSAAFTADQMEQVLSKAEQEAQHYCMARSVGVPEDRSAMTCGVRLLAKLDHIKPHYRSTNAHNVHVALAALADELQQAAHAAFAALPLPQREQVVEQQCQAVRMTAIDSFSSSLGNHSSSPLVPVVRSRLDADVSSHCSAATSANDRLIAALLGKGRVAYHRTYQDAFRAAFLSYAAAHAHASAANSNAPGADDSADAPTGAANGAGNGAAGGAGNSGAGAAATAGKSGPNTFPSATDDPHLFSEALFALLPPSTPPPPPRWLLALHSNASLLAQEAFSLSVSQGGLGWVVPGHDKFDFFLFQAIQWGKQRVREVGEGNVARVREYCGEMKGRLVGEYRKRVGEIQPLPDNDEVVVAKARHLASLILANYSAAVQPYLPSASVEEVRAQLQARVEEARQRLVDRNTELMAALCFEPLRDARDELNMQECDKTYHNIFLSKSWWSLKCLRPGPSLFFGFRASAFAVALKHLAKAQLRFKSGAASAAAASVASSPSATASSSPPPASSPSPAATGATASGPSPSQGEVDLVEAELSEATKHRVISAWLQRDLAVHANTVLTNCCLLLASLAALLLLLHSLLLRVKMVLGRKGRRGRFWGQKHESASGREKTAGMRNGAPVARMVAWLGGGGRPVRRTRMGSRAEAGGRGKDTGQQGREQEGREQEGREQEGREQEGRDRDGHGVTVQAVPSSRFAPNGLAAKCGMLEGPVAHGGMANGVMTGGATTGGMMSNGWHEVEEALARRHGRVGVQQGVAAQRNSSGSGSDDAACHADGDDGYDGGCDGNSDVNSGRMGWAGARTVAAELAAGQPTAARAAGQPAASSVLKGFQDLAGTASNSTEAQGMSASVEMGNRSTGSPSKPSKPSTCTAAPAVVASPPGKELLPGVISSPHSPGSTGGSGGSGGKASGAYYRAADGQWRRFKSVTRS